MGVFRSSFFLRRIKLAEKSFVRSIKLAATTTTTKKNRTYKFSGPVCICSIFAIPR